MERKTLIVTALHFLYAGLLGWAAGTDLQERRIFRVCTGAILIVSILLSLLSLPDEAGASGSSSYFLSCFLGGAVPAGILFLCDMIHPGSFGAGDIRLCFSAFICLTLPGALRAGAAAVESAAAFCLAGLFIGRGLPKPFPFGPFLAFAALTARIFQGR